MKARLVVEVGDYERYVIARYFGAAATAAKDQQRPRATRAQVRRFAQAALRKAVRDYADNLRGRSRSTARRLAIGVGPMVAEEPLVPLAEQQPELAGL